MAIGASEAGGLGSLACAQYTVDQARDAIAEFRRGTSKPLNVNFFAHTMPKDDVIAESRWRARLEPFYREAGLDPAMTLPKTGRAPFDEGFCALVDETRPEVVSFHFGLPDAALVERVRKKGAKILASATTVAEARWLEARGIDAIIAMGYEAGGHRGNFLSADMATQVGTMALVPQVVDAVAVPVIAAGGIADARGVAAALALGAVAAQVGTAYLFTPEAKIPAVHRAALETATDDTTAITNVFTGRPARGIVNRVVREVGPMSPDAPAFPRAGSGLAPLRAKAESEGRGDFTNLWAGQAAHLAPRGLSSFALTQELARLTRPR
jgi:nitronate monooxygenase